MSETKVQDGSSQASANQAPAAVAHPGSTNVALPPSPSVSEPPLKETDGPAKLPEPIKPPRRSPEVLKSLSQESLIKELDNSDFHYRQSALKELSQRKLDLEVVAEVLPKASLNTTTQLLQLLDKQQFGEAALTLRDVYAFDSLKELNEHRTTLLEERARQRQLSPGSIAESCSQNFVEIATIYSSSGLPEGIRSVKEQLASGSAKNASAEELEQIFLYLRCAAGNSEIEPNAHPLYSRIKDLAWGRMSPAAAIEQAMEINDASRVSIQSLTFGERWREHNGLSFEGYLVNRSARSVSNSLIPFSETDPRKDLYNSFLEHVNEFEQRFRDTSVDPAELSKLASFIRLEQKFIKLTSPMDSSYYDHKSSTVLKPLVESWLAASSKGDLKALSTIIEDSEDIAEVIRTRSALGIGLTECLYIENILRNPNLIAEDKSRWRKACQVIGEHRRLIAADGPEFDEARQLIVNRAEEGLVECFVNHNIEALENIALQFAHANSGIDSASRFARVLDYYGDLQQKKLLHAAQSYLGFSPKDFDSTLLSLLKSENIDSNNSSTKNAECQALLTRFSSNPPLDLQRIVDTYQRLDGIQENIHLDRPVIQISLAAQHKEKIIDALLSKNPETLAREISEAHRFAEPIMKGL